MQGRSDARLAGLRHILWPRDHRRSMIRCCQRIDKPKIRPQPPIISGVAASTVLISGQRDSSLELLDPAELGHERLVRLPLPGSSFEIISAHRHGHGDSEQTPRKNGRRKHCLSCNARVSYSFPRIQERLRSTAEWAIGRAQDRVLADDLQPLA